MIAQTEQAANRPGRYGMDQKDSQALKGVAILMMLCHHCFSEGRFEVGGISLWPFEAGTIMQISAYFKICITLFAFVSGYGLYLSFRRAQERKVPTGSWLWTRLVRTLSGYWVVVVLAWIVCGALSGMPARAYGFSESRWWGVYRMAMDFLGLNYFVGVEPMNGDWWYISTAVILIFLAPVLYGALEKHGFLFTMGLMAILQRLGLGPASGSLSMTYVPIFAFGMAFAKYGLPLAPARAADLRTGRGAGRLTLCLAGSLLLCMAAYRGFFELPYNNWWELRYSVLPLATILFSWMFLIRIPLVRPALAFLGRYSLNIWLVHQFIRGDYCGELIYGMPHFLLSILLLLAISLGISLVLEAAKRAIRYERWMERLIGLPDSISKRFAQR